MVASVRIKRKSIAIVNVNAINGVNVVNVTKKVARKVQKSQNHVLVSKLMIKFNKIIIFKTKYDFLNKRFISRRIPLNVTLELESSAFIKSKQTNRFLG